ncbi:MAG TPA: HEAT repeat domain-containing protein [Terriglobales bacterium]|nr:HEAT repeat domain-containing protein [Terriglobales bacterium]
MHPLTVCINLIPKSEERRISTAATTKREDRNASARAFIHSLNILVKYVRLYGFQHKRTEGQFEVTWNELQHGLPKEGDAGFLLGVSENRLLLDGVALETGQAERSFAQLLTAAGLASIQFSKGVTVDDFARLIRAFAVGGSKAQDVVQQIKDTFGDNKTSTIRINEVKFVASDPGSADVSVAAQIAAQTLGPEFKEWLNDPQKLLQLIAAAEGSRSGGAGGGAPIGSVPNVSGGASGEPSSGGSASTAGTGTWAGGVVPLQEEEVVQAIRLLTKFGEAGSGPAAQIEPLQKEITQADPNLRLNLQQLLESLAAKNPTEKTDTPLLMKAAEHMAIRFAMERFQKGDMKVNAVHQMLEHMSRQMETLRQILRVHEDKMSKAGLLVESHADILDRMFWAEVPEAGKKSVLLSNDAACVPSRNIRQFIIEVLLERGDQETVTAILQNYSNCLAAKDSDPRRRAAIGLSQLADLFAAPGVDLIGPVIHKVGEALVRDSDPEIQSLLSAAFVRLSSEAGNRKQYAALGEVCGAIEGVAKQRPAMANELRPRIGVENRLPEFIEEALRLPQVPRDLVLVLQRTSPAALEHLADRFFRCMRREECDRMVEIVKELGPAGLQQAREMLRTGPVRQASAVVGLLSRLDVPTLLELLPIRLKEWNRFYHDIVVRQIAYGAAPDRGRTLLEILEHLDAMVLPQAIDEIGMSGDRTTVPPLMVMAESGEAQGRSAIIQIKAVESLGRLRETESVNVLRGLLETKKMWKWTNHRELRIAAAQALAKIDPRYAAQVMSSSGLAPGELAIAPLDAAPACPWVRQRRYERIVLRKTLSAIISSSWGKSSIMLRELSLGGGMGTKEDNLRVGSEANIDISTGVRHIRGQVLLRRARVNEVGFEIVSTDMESRLRLRGILMEAVERAPEIRGTEWQGERKS